MLAVTVGKRENVQVEIILFQTSFSTNIYDFLVQYAHLIPTFYIPYRSVYVSLQPCHIQPVVFVMNLKTKEYYFLFFCLFRKSFVHSRFFNMSNKL